MLDLTRQKRKQHLFVWKKLKITTTNRNYNQFSIPWNRFCLKVFWQTREKLHFHSSILHSSQKISGIVRFWYHKCAVSFESVRNDLPPWNTSFIVFALTRPTIFHTRGEHANHYATDAVYYLWTETKVPMQWLHHTKQNIHSEIWRIAADWIIHAKHMLHFFRIGE